MRLSTVLEGTLAAKMYHWNEHIGDTGDIRKLSSPQNFPVSWEEPKRQNIVQ
jgi:hypothetical protein